jgi:hypothetical protein
MLAQTMEINIIVMLLFISGIGHIALCAGSIFIPRVLKWSDHLKNLQPLLKQMFWTYAAYILVINFCFGIISLIATEELLNRSMLAKSITLFISLYWLARIGIQFFYFDKSNAPKGFIYTLGEISLIALFVFFTVVYFIAFLYKN